VNDLPPQELVAKDFMSRKGYPELVPTETERVADSYCWYFYYDLPEGELDLEVTWNPETREWFAQVMDFRLHCN
jgi:hypothetical protein